MQIYDAAEREFWLRAVGMRQLESDIVQDIHICFCRVVEARCVYQANSSPSLAEAMDRDILSERMQAMADADILAHTS